MAEDDLLFVIVIVIDVIILRAPSCPPPQISIQAFIWPANLTGTL